ncbi:RNA-directed DNA polymerase, eukaryota, reverse transcriptase zinc-binding domain protein, partial [Tanacetum coccineum]
MAWYRKCKKPLMIFKVDFEKAFDSLRWYFLEKLSFGVLWRFWIKGCLGNARTSILVNWSPTIEFELSRGLRQGDPLSPLLFILAMEGLHTFICKVVDLGIYSGVRIGDNNLSLSHLIYANDVIFMGEWSHKNAQNLLGILRCFYLVSGLKINVQKSNISGVGVFDDTVSSMAIVLGCGAAKFPLKYLGVPVGCNLGRCSNWDVIVPVSTCNKLESTRNLFFIGGDLGDKKMTWVSWKRCLASKDRGGLGIGSINALNVGILFKWIWRFFTRPCDLWAVVIKDLYGHNGGIFAAPSHSSCSSPYSGILSSIRSLNKKGIDLLSLCSRKLRKGISISFWNDVWCGNQALKSKFPRVYMLDSDKNCCIADHVALQDWFHVLRRQPRGGIESSQFSDMLQCIGSVVLSDDNDSWQWSLDNSEGFSVASVRYLIDSHILDVNAPATRWNKAIPIKV